MKANLPLRAASLSSRPTLSRRQFLKTAFGSAGACCFAAAFHDFARGQQPAAELNASETAAALYRNAFSLVSPTPEEAAAVSNLLMDGAYYDASLICGPLSMAPLLGLARQGDKLVFTGPLLAPGILPAEMWLADYEGSDGNPQLFEAAFDPRYFAHDQITENIIRVDFDREKLLPGDFMYLTGGSYTHFITVSRRDEAGRSYTITNTPREDGRFTIDEKMLWDPALQDGFIRDFSRGIGPETAYTGRTGYHRWRPRVPLETLAAQQDCGSRNLVLRNLMLSYFRRIAGDWNALIVDLDNDQMLFEWRSRMRYHPASTIKLPIALAALQLIDQLYATELSSIGFFPFLDAFGFAGRSFRQLFEFMLIHSEEQAASDLYSFINQNRPIDDLFREIGLQFTQGKPRRSCQSDLFLCWRHLFRKDLLPEEQTAFLMKCLSAYTENDDGRLGVIPHILSGTRIWNKRGTIVEGPYTLQDCGILEVPLHGLTRHYYIGIAGTRPDADDICDDVYLTARIEEFSRIFASFLRYYDV